MATTKVFGKGFAEKFWADKAFATAAQGRAVELIPGIITVDGQIIAVERANERNVDLTPAVVTVIGQVLAVSRVREVALEPALVAVTGQTITVLRSGRQVQIIPGQVAVLGTQIAVSRGRAVNLVPAQVLVTGRVVTVARGDTNAVRYTIQLRGFIPSGTGYEPLQLQSFPLHSGTAFRLRIPVEDSAGESIDISGAQPRLIVVRRPGTEAVLDTNDGNVALEIEDGNTVLFTVADEDCEDLSGTYHYEAWLKTASDRDMSIARGYVTFKRSARLAA